MNEKKLIAITGGIGSGKSTALNIIKKLGYKTLSSDAIVGELYQKIEIRQLLKPLFPNAVNGEDFVLDKSEIARQVFTDKNKHLALTELITPMVMAEILTRTTQDQICFVEVPLLFECDFADLFDSVLVITRPLDARVESVMARSNLTKQQVLDRISNQFDYDSSDLTPYAVVLNDGNVDKLEKEILNFINTLN